MIVPASYYPHLTIYFRALLAELLAIAAIFYLDLPNPSWALLTIAFLGLKVEIGSTYVKSLARIAGTVLGGLTGAFIIITFYEHPGLLIGSLALVILLSASFTSRYQGMAGYGGFLGGITCLLVVTFCLTNTDIYNIGYYTLNRISEICLGVIALLISSYLIWPNSSQSQLTQSFITLRTLLGQMAALANNPQPDNSKSFVALHSELSKAMLDADQQRYYTAFIDHRIQRISGTLQETVDRVLGQMGAFVMLRRVLLRSQSHPQKAMVARDAITEKYQRLDAHLQATIDLLSSPDALRQSPAVADHNLLLDLRNYRYTLYRSLTAVLALCLGFAVWIITEAQSGPLVVVGSVLITMARILARAPKIPLVSVLIAMAITFATVFAIQYLLVIQIDSFWPFFLLSLPVQALTIWNFYRKPTSLISMLCMLLFPLLMPISSPPVYQPEVFLSNTVALLSGMILGCLCIEIVGNPDRVRLSQDYVHALALLLNKTMSGHIRISPAEFRRQVMPLNNEMLTLYPDEQDAILNWMDTATGMGSFNLKLQGLSNAPGVCEQTRQLYKDVQQQITYLVDHLHLPNPSAVATAEGAARQATMDALFDRAWELYSNRKTELTLDLMILAGAVRRHHRFSNPGLDHDDS
ncbi:FUSC family protein [Parendozoicomonas haliclonae]|uniref:p-hydroxybenzoic acid efflux subunit AaeB n=1 Tax=Parendozoicomonas haliclonae TaxID=1960125 RepID=A0A1X7AR47_9GAMM|nr:FUSC family protein [Parendozoicomonas haliclonae]SMA50623.1 p-hydroxybenzoic acid efflux subunit AaeB [Parendozoicomonas haliclonae]